MEAAGVDHEALLDTYIRAINICTAERPNDLTISVHMCRGNFRVRDFSPVFRHPHHINSSDIDVCRAGCTSQKEAMHALPQNCSEI